MAGTAKLEIAIREKRFAVLPQPVFSDFALIVPDGEALAIIGPSGVGKSTLLRMIGGIDEDFAGTITLDGAPLAAARPPGFVFQDPRLLPWLTARANLAAMHPDAPPAKLQSLLARVGLATFEDAYPHEMSGGMQRRVAMARALASDPRLLLMDEPFVSLEPPLALQLQRLLLDLLAERATTLILVTHAAEEAARLADRVIMLRGAPARILGDMHIPTPKETRSDAEIAELAAGIRGQFDG